MDNIDKFAAITNKLKESNIPFEIIERWCLSLPHDTPQEHIHRLISICRELSVVSWHIVFEDTSDTPLITPYIKVFWDEEN